MGRIILAGLAFLTMAIGLLAAVHLFNPVEAPFPVEETLESERCSFALPEPLGELTAGRISLVYFYSGCCGHCSAKLPEVAALARRCDARGVTVVGVEYGGSRESCGRNRREFDLPGTLIPDERGQICNPLGVRELAVLVLDEQGNFVYRGGPEDPAAVERALFP